MNRHPVELNHLEFAHCYKCYRQPIGPNSSFIVLTCCHIYCETCQNLCTGNQAPDLMFCFVCRKAAKYEQLRRYNDVVVVVAAFQDKLAKAKKVANAQNPIAMKGDLNADQIEFGTSTMDGQRSVGMTRKRYTELIRIASGKSNQITGNRTVDHAEQTMLSTLPQQRIASSFQSASQSYRQIRSQKEMQPRLLSNQIMTENLN